MKKRLLRISLALVLCCGIGTASVFAFVNQNSEYKEDETTISVATSGDTMQYVSSVGGINLPKTDKDYVSIDRESIISKNTTVAMDDVGRELSTDGSGDNGRQVGIFYFFTRTGHPDSSEPKFYEDVLAEGDPKQNWNNVLTIGASHWWAEPMFGFYNIEDDYIMRKHIEMFIYADIDFILVDATNNAQPITKALKLMKLLHEYNEMGWDAPKIAFYTNTDSSTVAAQIYGDIYYLNKYPDTWYMIEGKPLLIGVDLSLNYGDMFYVRDSWWPSTKEPTPNSFPWIDFADDARVAYDSSGKHGVIPVSPAQNCGAGATFSSNVLYGQTAETGGARGRSYHNGKDNITEDSVIYGYNFQEEWDNAIASDAEIALVTNWNEWTAGAWSDDGKWCIFDLITPEYSRDIEPMKGGFGDNYYMQMVENIRKFKNTGSKVIQKDTKTIDIDGDFGQWNAVKATYADMAQGGVRRDAIGTAQRYINDTGRNEMIYSKITQDSEHIYFYVQTAKDITDDYTTGSWMNLFLDTDGKLDNSWNGYEYIVNYSVATADVSKIAKYNGTSFEDVGEAKFRVYGNQMMVSVPKSVLGISDTEVSLNFKWADSRVAYTDVVEFYTKGDAMPYGRFNYAYHSE